MKKQFFFAIFFLLFYSLNSYSQIPGVQWAKSISGLQGDSHGSITVDPSGNIYTVGFYKGVVDVDPGSGVFNLTSNGNYDVFILKQDNLGNFLWAKSIGGSAIDFTRSVALDPAGNIVIMGVYTGTVDFDPGNGVY